MSRIGWPPVVLVAVAGLGLAGCNGFQIILPGSSDGLTRLETTVTDVQVEDPRDVDLPPPLDQEGDTVIINQDVTVITNIEQDLVVEELPNHTVLGFDNQTGFDIYVRYLADDAVQGIYIFDGETLLLEYPCLFSVELLSEDDIDPVSGVLVNSIELINTVYANPDDFVCGDALIVTFDPFSVQGAVQLIDLLP